MMNGILVVDFPSSYFSQNLTASKKSLTRALVTDSPQEKLEFR